MTRMLFGCSSLGVSLPKRAASSPAREGLHIRVWARGRWGAHSMHSHPHPLPSTPSSIVDRGHLWSPPKIPCQIKDLWSVWWRIGRRWLTASNCLRTLRPYEKRSLERHFWREIQKNWGLVDAVGHYGLSCWDSSNPPHSNNLSVGGPTTGPPEPICIVLSLWQLTPHTHILTRMYNR